MGALPKWMREMIRAPGGIWDQLGVDITPWLPAYSDGRRKGRRRMGARFGWKRKSRRAW